jgi:hypothetical protein
MDKAFCKWWKFKNEAKIRALRNKSSEIMKELKMKKFSRWGYEEVIN